jgi:hypothetical protein
MNIHSSGLCPGVQLLDELDLPRVVNRVARDAEDQIELFDGGKRRR